MAEMTRLENVRKQAETRMHDAQETIKMWSGAATHDVRDSSHKALLVSFGTVGTSQDAVADLIKWTTDFYERSVKRGQEMEDWALKEARHYWKEGRQRVEAAEDDLEGRVKHLVERIEVPTRAKVQNLVACRRTTDGSGGGADWARAAQSVLGDASSAKGHVFVAADVDRDRSGAAGWGGGARSTAAQATGVAGVYDYMRRVLPAGLVEAVGLANPRNRATASGRHSNE